MPVRREVKSILMFILFTFVIFMLFVVSIGFPFDAVLVFVSILTTAAIGLIIAYRIFKDKL